MIYPRLQLITLSITIPTNTCQLIHCWHSSVTGKTTLAKQTFPNYEYFNFEDPNTRTIFRADPHNFLKKFMGAPGLILDEPQNDGIPVSWHDAYNMRQRWYRCGSTFVG
jgi:hypothetical protein